MLTGFSIDLQKKMTKCIGSRKSYGPMCHRTLVTRYFIFSVG